MIKPGPRRCRRVHPWPRTPRESLGSTGQPRTPSTPAVPTLPTVRGSTPRRWRALASWSTSRPTHGGRGCSIGRGRRDVALHILSSNRPGVAPPVPAGTIDQPLPPPGVGPPDADATLAPPDRAAHFIHPIAVLRQPRGTHPAGANQTQRPRASSATATSSRTPLTSQRVMRAAVRIIGEPPCARTRGSGRAWGGGRSRTSGSGRSLGPGGGRGGGGRWGNREQHGEEPPGDGDGRVAELVDVDGVRPAGQARSAGRRG
jgi:hypothetical protein